MELRGCARGGGYVCDTCGRFGDGCRGWMRGWGERKRERREGGKRVRERMVDHFCFVRGGEAEAAAMSSRLMGRDREGS